MVNRLSYPFIHKKQPVNYAHNQVCGLSGDSVRLLLFGEKGSNRYSGFQAYYKGFDPALTIFNT